MFCQEFVIIILVKGNKDVRSQVFNAASGGLVHELSELGQNFCQCWLFKFCMEELFGTDLDRFFDRDVREKTVHLKRSHVSHSIPRHARSRMDRLSCPSRCAHYTFQAVTLEWSSKPFCGCILRRIHHRLPKKELVSTPFFVFASTHRDSHTSFFPHLQHSSLSHTRVYPPDSVLLTAFVCFCLLVTSVEALTNRKRN